MQSAAWKAIFNRVPREHHEIMMVVTSIGIEINVKSIQLLEPDYVVIRGRLGGTTDAGRLFFVPYDQINYITFNKEIREQQVAEMLGVDAPPPRAPIPEGDAVKAAAEAAAEVEKEAAPTPTEPAKGETQPGKMALLERIRSRIRPKPEGEGPGAAPDK
ncbi:MAG TPA: hypothetical protein VGP68_22975 [Gemmataceae bacterium]|jgi:hypothetical protein|nr:hypothetical protein [Gemmataceae bacterium]